MQACLQEQFFVRIDIGGMPGTKICEANLSALRGEENGAGSGKGRPCFLWQK